MKTYCKDTDITDYETIKRAIHKCLANKLRRKDVREYLLGCDVKSECKRDEYSLKIKTDFEYLDGLISKRARELQIQLKDKDLYLLPIKYDVRYDTSSRKERNIATQSIKQQVCDYVALECLSPFFAYIGEYQIAGIKGRGTDFGFKTIKRWLRDKKCKYAGKCDIRKCYESIDRDLLMKFLLKHIRNPDLLWLIHTLIWTYKQGLSIGSILSQYLCSLYLAQLYHKISERMYRIRKRKGRMNLVKHVLFQMDDILVLGSNRRDLNRAMYMIQAELLMMELRTKDGIKVFKILKGKEKRNSGADFVDILGFRYYGFKVKTSLRRRTFKKCRRCYIRVCNNVRNRQKIPIERARRFVSLYGRLRKTNHYKLRCKYSKIFQMCKGVISDYDKGKIYRGTARS